MCGIIGYVSGCHTPPRPPADSRDRMFYRGPDDGAATTTLRPTWAPGAWPSSTCRPRVTNGC